MIKPDRGTTPFKELKNGSVDVDVSQKMKELKRMIQFDDPACLLFTSVSPQTGFILIILENFKIKCALVQSIGVGCYSATSRTCETLRRRLPNHNVF